MNKKKLVTGLLSAAFIGGVLVTTALPADAANTYSQNSTGSIKFKSGGLELPPIGPPIIEPVPKPSGDFGLLYVPKEFNFAETAVPTSVVTTPTVVPIDTNWEGSPATNTGGSAGSNTTTKHFAVGDVRGKRAAGWRLEAKMTAELSTGSKNLTGAKITMAQTLNELTPQPSPNPWLSAPATAGPHTPDTVTSAVTLDTSSTLIMSAAAETVTDKADGRGEGYWQGKFTNINLNIPASAMNAVVAEEQYTGTIDWTLTDAV
ncbi:WxL domain-containing protein [Enterococcus sp. DIV0756]|uniref:WxL domain-containing protein n=1 Tax=Enterococcus sp. DIV0756 TaxID=2774636 RepID=UPI003F27A7C7